MKPVTDLQILVQVPARLKLQFVLHMFKVENSRIQINPIRACSLILKSIRHIWYDQ